MANYIIKMDNADESKVTLDQVEMGLFFTGALEDMPPGTFDSATERKLKKIYSEIEAAFGTDDDFDENFDDIFDEDEATFVYAPDGVDY